MRASFHETVAATLRELPAPVFFAGFNARMSRLTVHVHAGCDIAGLRAQVASAVQKAGEPVEVTVCAHRLGQLAFPRSLERWLSLFKVGQTVLHDPTMIISHARSLLAAAKSCRAALGSALAGSFFDPDRRTLFVLVRGDAAALQPRVATLVASAFDGPGASIARISGASSIRVQVVEELPQRRLIPVDAKSSSPMRRIGRTLWRWLVPASLALAVSGAPAAANTGPVGLEARSANVSIAAQTQFGVLKGLSAFSEASRHDAFADATLQWFFSETSEGQAARGISVAQAKKKKIDGCVDIQGKPTGADCAPPFPMGS
jgi:hypothetical protein